MANAAQNGHIDVVNWLLKNLELPITSKTLAEVWERKHYSIVKCLADYALTEGIKINGEPSGTSM